MKLNFRSAPRLNDRPIDLIGFDLDGTLVDSSRDIAAALNHMLGSIGRAPLPLDVVHGMTGGGARHLILTACEATGGLDGLDMDALLDVQLRYYADHAAEHSRLFDGVVAALDALDAMGVTCAVATNKHEHLARLLLDQLGIGDRMAFVIGGDTLGPGRAKPHPDMLLAMMDDCGTKNAAFVGDTAYDVGAAAAASIPSIFVDFIAQPITPCPLGADFRIHHFDELVPLLTANSMAEFAAF